MTVRHDNPELYRENVYKSWKVMEEILGRVSDDCFITHTEPNPGVGYDCLTLVTKSESGSMESRILMNRNGVNAFVDSQLYENVWTKVSRRGAQAVADELIALAGLSRAIS